MSVESLLKSNILDFRAVTILCCATGALRCASFCLLKYLCRPMVYKTIFSADIIRVARTTSALNILYSILAVAYMTNLTFLVWFLVTAIPLSKSFPSTLKGSFIKLESFNSAGSIGTAHNSPPDLHSFFQSKIASRQQSRPDTPIIPSP